MFSVLTIEQENQFPGTSSSQWQIVGSGDPTLQGFADGFSFNNGETVDFKIDDQTLTSFHVNIYRLGYYQGLGARLVDTIVTGSTTETVQPAPLSDPSVGLFDCGNWSVSASWAIPADATSGLYFAHVVRDDSGGSSHIPFVVRRDSSTSPLLFQTSDTTWQAYNSYGGKSLYLPNRASRAYKVSYNRPFDTRGNGNAANWLFADEVPMIRFLERNGYEVSYFSGIDTDRYGSLLANHDVFLSVGHDEYWSGAQRTNVENARDAGMHLAFFSGNEVFWKTRWENSIDGSGDTYRTLVCYKETHDNAKIDPSSEWTGTWRDSSFSPPSNGARPENALTGSLFTVDSGRSDPLRVWSDQGKLRFWRNTSLTSIADGQSVTFASGVVGHEWNSDLDNGFRPAGLINLSRNTIDVSPLKLLDFGNTVGNGTATHSLTLHKADSGALVFGAGTINWAWGLDVNHDPPSATLADVRIQQATVNLFADMGVQPATLMGGLVAASASTDATAPTATITTASGLTVAAGSPVTISGTAADVGGLVAGVEVSTDGGTTWHPATAGTTSWSYTFVPNTLTALTILARATDDSANRGSNSASITLNMHPDSMVSVFSPIVEPLRVDAADALSVELGVRFRADVDGYISGIRFYKATANTGTHVGSLWTNAGALLARVTFSGETTSGWQTALFSAPVPITAGTTYVASYFAPVGHYAGDNWFFKQFGFGNGPMRALKSGVDGVSGVFRYNGSPIFPNTSFRDSNYWVDALFSTSVDTTPPGATSNATAPSPGAAHFDFTITYTDVAAGLDASTLDGSDITVTGPNGYLASASLISVDQPGNGATRTVTYRITAPDGTWNIADNGTYTIHQTSSQVGDLASNFRPAGTIGTFTASIPFAYQIGTTVFADFHPAGMTLSVSNAAGGVALTDGNTTLSFTGVTSVSVTGTAGADTLNFNGPLNQSLSFSGGAGADVLNVNSGTFTTAYDLASTTPNLTLNVGAASVVFNQSQHLAALNIGATGLAHLAANGSRYLQLAALSITPGGKLDLDDNDFVLTYPGPSPFTTIQQLIFQGFAPGGTGIVSSAGQIAGNTILAIFDTAIVGTTEWPPGSGNMIPANAIVGKYTFFGDMNLDGQVTGDDYTVIDANLNTTPPIGAGWLFGDATFDGVITGDDYTVIDANLGDVGGPL